MAAFSGFIIMEEYGGFLAKRHAFRQLGRKEGSMDIQLEIETITPYADICPAEYPPTHAILHDKRDHEVSYYNATYGDFVNRLNYFMDKNYEFPDIMEYTNYRYAVWNPELSVEAKEAETSAWNPSKVNGTTSYVEGNGFIPPRAKDGNVIHIEGNYAAFNSWFPGNFGHFAHDWLPSIALMRHILPDDTKFLLLDNKMSRKFIEFLDRDFNDNRVIWVPYDQVYEIHGKLWVNLPLGVPDPLLGCCSGWDPMRQWIAEKHPYQAPDDEKHVVWYSRGGDDGDTRHGRVMEKDNENATLTIIREKLVQHQKPSTKIVIFNGHDEDGNTLSIEQQFNIFRKAHAFIGPHGSGFGGNYLWLDPFASSCKERTQILEFMPGPENPEIHALYASYYGNIRKWPLDYHNLLYTKKSTYTTTFIDLESLKDALDAMWGTPETLNQAKTTTEDGATATKEEEAPKQEEGEKDTDAATTEEQKSEQEEKEPAAAEKKQSVEGMADLAKKQQQAMEALVAAKQHIDDLLASITTKS